MGALYRRLALGLPFRGANYLDLVQDHFCRIMGKHSNQNQMLGVNVGGYLVSRVHWES